MTRLPSLFLALIALISAVSAQNSNISFVEPQVGFSGTIGDDCPLSWTQDTTGNWTNARIDLMTGPDMMKRSLGPISNGTFDATKQTSASWKCPDVTPGNIYFYRMSRINSPTGLSDAIYTLPKRFCIYSDLNDCTAPHAYQPTGETDGEPWGRGYHRNRILEQVNGGDQAVSFFRPNNTDL